MKKTALLLPVALLLTSLPCAAQGPLTPSGAPGETMHTLEEIHDRTDPRTPISSLPYTITQPGSYYVVSNLNSTGGGIVIQTNGVTVDLMGFSLTGDGDPGENGIHVDGATNAAIDKVVIKNGTISQFSWGLWCQYMNNSRIEQMVVSGNTGLGVILSGTSSGQCNGNTITDCSISGNNDSGVYFFSAFGQCDGNTIANCTISGNTNSGVYLEGSEGQCNGNTVADCNISKNDSYGINLTGVAGQCDGNTIRENTISKNTYRGISLSSTEGNRVEANNVWGTTGDTSYGIYTASSTGNFILKNTCVGQTNNFQLSAGDTYGPIVTDSGSLPTSGAGAHPWANFSR